MKLFLEPLFIGSFALIFFAYFGYPISLYVLGLFRRKTLKKVTFSPAVTLIVTAHNEGRRIAYKLKNTYELDYPRERLQIIVASDGSKDETNSLVKAYEKDGIELLALREHRGKENAQKEAVKRARGDLLVFTDVATRLNTEGLREIVANFSDASVGCVSSEDRIIGNGGNPGGESIYVDYEMWLRRLESRANSLVGMSGSFFAARKEVCQDFSENMQSDFRTVLNSVKMGLRAVSDPKAIGYYQDVSDKSREFDRKVRTVLRGLTVFFRHLEFLNVFQYGFFSYQLFCHKLLRWLIPIFLSIVLASNAFLAGKSYLYLLMLFFQIIFYGLAAWGWARKQSSPKLFIRIPSYFLTVNASIIVAWWRYLNGHRLVMWTPSKR